ncbi:hypothetical protein QO004_004062 [Rhizobium mesoamericanum]|uniref:hypothetical protein n=1 Tax=Rhizobium mesoamericanum TaxID=1079800 RepID=UPI00277F114E|nr:hypothetical protein [Rhizobium mesoamericanum]MDQ0562257.1 hypothetical protein [Rhizobium mesoamericanum]
MHQQTKPFIVEIKTSRKLKPIDRENSICGKLHLATDRDTPTATDGRELSAAGEADDRR